MTRAIVFLLFLSALVSGCTRSAHSRTPSSFEFTTTTGVPWPLQQNLANSEFTVIEFFSSTCPVQRAHDPRLIELFHRYQPRGVAFVVIDSEVDASPDHDKTEARERGYPFPILIDESGRFADWVRAGYSTFTLVVDRRGTIRYEGGIDSDRVELSASATPYLANALDDLLSGKRPRLAVGKAFGCMLRKW